TFGEKDYQQIAVIRRMVELEGFDLEIVPCPIVRHDDGLAMSSRNVRLSAHQRSVAPNIHRVLVESLKWAESMSIDEVVAHVTEAINCYPEMEVEYYQIVDSKTMQPISKWPEAGMSPAVGCITVYLGDVRLIDNITYPVGK
ncbi:MAG: pantoate--beta-alanine ligase, partial [Muribaculum sp.]|nr:pantoate--beta-alanine ligase [Muribaculum sp.]